MDGVDDYCTNRVAKERPNSESIDLANEKMNADGTIVSRADNMNSYPDSNYTVAEITQNANKQENRNDP